MPNPDGLKPLLSILIPTIPQRRAQLVGLRRHLYNQIQKSGNLIEITVATSPPGYPQIGKKRQEMLDLTNGDYVVFIDDDDWVADNYVSLIVAGLAGRPDVVGINGIITVNGANPKPFQHSIKYMEWYTNPSGLYCRCPNHLNPVRRELALQAGYPDMPSREDLAYSLALRKLVKTEHMIHDPLYYYRYIVPQSRPGGA